MIIKIASVLLLLVALSGCSKQPASNANKAENSPQPAQGVQASVSLPFEITVVKTDEDKERHEIRTRAAALFAAKKYDGLEELAHQYRISKACYAEGFWKLKEVYEGINPAEEAPEAEWRTQLEALREWVRIKPASTTARVALAGMLTSYAWKARGSGYANTVTDQGWKLMGERLTESVRVIEGIGVTQEKCPRQWSTLMTAALGLGVEKSQYEAIFRQAVRSEPDFAGYYLGMAYYLLPRWHGEQGDTAAFAKHEADRLGGEEGDLLYARIAWYLQGVEGNVFDDTKLSWERVDKGFQVMDKRFPNSLYVQNARAYLAVMGCDRTQFPRGLVDGLHGQIDLATWTDKENFIRLTKDLYSR